MTQKELIEHNIKMYSREIDEITKEMSKKIFEIQLKIDKLKGELKNEQCESDRQTYSGC